MQHCHINFPFQTPRDLSFFVYPSSLDAVNGSAVRCLAALQALSIICKSLMWSAWLISTWGPWKTRKSLPTPPPSLPLPHVHDPCAAAGLEYHLNKFDVVCMNDFNAGAMENTQVPPPLCSQLNPSPSPFIASQQRSLFREFHRILHSTPYVVFGARATT